MKSKLASSPILQLPDVKTPFILRTDASDVWMGAMLLQETDQGKFPVAYISKTFSKCQRNYSIIERECLAIVWAVQKFEPFLYGNEFTIETDHQPLKCTSTSKIANGRIMRCPLSLQPFRFRINVIKDVIILVNTSSVGQSKSHNWIFLHQILLRKNVWTFF